jgi:hypothetical protein
MTQRDRAIFVLTSDLMMMSAVNASAAASTIPVRCLPTIDLLPPPTQLPDTELCVIIDADGMDLGTVALAVSAFEHVVMIALVDHPYPDVVQTIKLRGIPHIMKRDVLPSLLQTLTQGSPV